MKQKLLFLIFIFSISLYGKNINKNPFFNPIINSLTSNISTCEGGNAIFEIIGTPNADVSYNINGGGSQVVVLDSSGYGQIFISSVNTDQTIYLTSIQLGGDFTTLTNIETVTVYQSPVIVSYDYNFELCDGGYLNINLASNLPNTTYSYTSVSNNINGYPSVGDESTLNQIINLSNTNLSGQITIIIAPHANGCVGSSVYINVFVNPNPQPTLVDGEIIIEQPSGIVITPYVLDSGLNNTNYSFEWYHNNILINGATDNVYTATESGNYYVIATNNSTSCLGYSNTAIVTENTLSSENFNLKSNIKIYPNPANEILNIFSDKTSIKSISIVNMIGQKLISKEINSNDFKINISNLSLGSYFIQLNTSNGNKVIKFVKN